MHPVEAETKTSCIFINKLWQMVNDPSTNHLIHWNPSGTSFVIPKQAQFWSELLPKYYKHNNLSSFVRQLNMYGFHKVFSLENNTPHSKEEKILFSHQCFLRDQPERLKEIKRNGGKSKSNESFRMAQFAEHINTQLGALKTENALLWKELNNVKQQNLKQQQIVCQLMEFLATVVRSRMRFGVKRGNKLRVLRESLKKIKKDASAQDFLCDLDFMNEGKNLCDAVGSCSASLAGNPNIILQSRLNNEKNECFFTGDGTSEMSQTIPVGSELDEFNYFLNEKPDNNVLLEFLDLDKKFQYDQK